MFEPEFLRKQMYCIEESTCDIAGTFRRPHSDSAPEELCPPRYAPVYIDFLLRTNEAALFHAGHIRNKA